MDLISVESSMIAAAGYDPESQTLVVLFNNGKAYDYYEVPSEEYQGLMEAESKGQYMRSHIMGNYSYASFKGWPKKA